MTSFAHGKSSCPRLVIFGCGYVGNAVAESAAARGIAVTALTRNVDTAAKLRANGIEAVIADLAGDRWHSEIPSAPEFAVNCVSSGGGGVEGYRHSYLAGIESIVRWTNTHGAVGTFVYTSSTSVYPHDGGARVTETAASLNEGTTAAIEDRPSILRATEQRVSENASGFRRWFILRLAGIYGPARHHLVDQVRSGEVAGFGAHHLNLVHRDDIAAAVCACLMAEARIGNEIFNVADDGAAPKHEIVAWLAGRLGVQTPSFTGAPAGGRRAVTPDRIIANDTIKQVLGWAPRYPTFREGYEAILAEKA